MADRSYYGVADTGTYQTSAPNPHVDLAGAGPDVFAIEQTFANALSSGNTATVRVRKDRDNWAVYSNALFTDATPDIIDLTGATLVDSLGSLADEDAVEVIGLSPDVVVPRIASTLTTADLTAALNTHYLLDVSGLTATRNLILPAGTMDGDFVSWELKTNAPAAYELILKGDTAVIVTLRGTSATAAEVTRYFIEGESGRAVFDGTEWRINRTDDGRIPCQMVLRLTTECDGETASAWTLPTSKGGAWTEESNIGACGSTANGSFTVRRANSILASAHGRMKDAAAAGNVFAIRIYNDTQAMEIANDGDIVGGFVQSFASATGQHVPSLADVLSYYYFSSLGGTGLTDERCRFSVIECL